MHSCPKGTRLAPSTGVGTIDRAMLEPLHPALLATLDELDDKLAALTSKEGAANPKHKSCIYDSVDFVGQR